VVKYEKIALFDEFLVLLGSIISRLFTCSNAEKNKQTQQGVLTLVLSLKPHQTENGSGKFEWTNSLPNFLKKDFCKN
jgi:hypothetical protein